MMRFLRLLARSFISAVIVLALLGGTGYWLYHDAEIAGPLGEPRTVVVPARRGVADIADLLVREGVLRRRLPFVLLAKLSGRGSVLKPGEYEFPAAASAMQTLDIIATGRTVKHRLTIPEGLTSAEVVALVRDAPALEGEAGPPPGEGSLLPDTYSYSFGDSRKELVARMQHGMTHLLGRMWSERRTGLPLAGPQEAVILASIVEKETAREEERAHIAGVYINRLRLGMRLQADPTVLFALGEDGAGKIDRPLTHADLAIDSPYNTYVVKGLPPGPIANPGRASLRAAVRPERTEDLYFVADGSGGHVFAKTLADQTRNIAQYRHGTADEAIEPPPVASPAPPAADAVRPPPHAEPEKPHPAAAIAAAVPHKRVAQQTAQQTGQQAAHLRHCRHDPAHPCPH